MKMFKQIEVLLHYSKDKYNTNKKDIYILYTQNKVIKGRRAQKDIILKA